MKLFPLQKNSVTWRVFEVFFFIDAWMFFLTKYWQRRNNSRRERERECVCMSARACLTHTSHPRTHEPANESCDIIANDLFTCLFQSLALSRCSHFRLVLIALHNTYITAKNLTQECFFPFFIPYYVAARVIFSPI